MIDIDKMFDVSNKMSSLTRYSQIFLIKDESVLEHTGFVCLMSYFIGCEIKKTDCIDMGVLMSKSVVHDIDEIITGDIPRPTKYYSDDFREAVQKIEDKNMKIISANIDLDQMYSDWKDAKTGKEGFIVSLSDCLALVNKGLYEKTILGNIGIIETLVSLPKRISSIKNERIFSVKGNKVIDDICMQAKEKLKEIGIL